MSVSEVSPERWNELYWGGDYPSLRTLSSRFKTDAKTLAKHFRAVGIATRTRAQQNKIDWKLKKRKSTRGVSRQGNGRESFGVEMAKTHSGKRQTRDHVQKRARAIERKRTVACGWCGTRIEKAVSLLKCEHPSCSRSCGASQRQHKRCHPHTPRPLIVERLWELAEKDKPTRILIKSGPGTGTWLPHTPERLLKLGEGIGAREPEAEAVIDRQREEAQALIEKRNA
jgi:hypothetical protein